LTHSRLDHLSLITGSQVGIAATCLAPGSNSYNHKNDNSSSSSSSSNNNMLHLFTLDNNSSNNNKHGWVDVDEPEATQVMAASSRYRVTMTTTDNELQRTFDEDGGTVVVT
jgi:hypothetical protein